MQISELMLKQVKRFLDSLVDHCGETDTGRPIWSSAVFDALDECSGFCTLMGADEYFTSFSVSVSTLAESRVVQFYVDGNHIKTSFKNERKIRLIPSETAQRALTGGVIQ